MPNSSIICSRLWRWVLSSFCTFCLMVGGRRSDQGGNDLCLYWQFSRGRVKCTLSHWWGIWSVWWTATTTAICNFVKSWAELVANQVVMQLDIMLSRMHLWNFVRVIGEMPIFFSVSWQSKVGVPSWDGGPLPVLYCSIEHGTAQHNNRPFNPQYMCWTWCQHLFSTCK